jgi:hypothetical protein
MAEVESLFGTSSLTPPRPRIAKPAEPSSADALGAALLAGILQDLSTLKEAAHQQGGINAAFNGWAAAQQALNASLAQADRDQAEVNRHQAEGNAAQAICNAEVLKLIERHALFVERVTALLGDLDERLSAIEGKRTIAPEPADAETSTGVPAA